MDGTVPVAEANPPGADGSIALVLATDTPPPNRKLTYLATCAVPGRARAGAAMSDASGDDAVGFSSAREVRRHVPAG